MSGAVAPTGAVWLVGCGSRDWEDAASVARILEGIRYAHPLLTIVEGRARGADLLVGQWAEDNLLRGVHHIRCPARWEDYPARLRWKAGHDRNRQMIDLLVGARERGHTVAIIAFKEALDPSLFIRTTRSRGGTEDCIRRGWTAEIDVHHVSHPAIGSARLLKPPPSFFD